MKSSVFFSLLILVPYVRIGSTNADICKTILLEGKQTCTCSDAPDGINLQCGRIQISDSFGGYNGHAVIAKFSRRRSLEITCSNPSWSAYADSWNLGYSVPHVALQNCLLNSDDSLESLFSRINVSVSTIESLRLELPESVKLLPDFFLDGLTALQTLEIKNSGLESLTSRVFRDSNKLQVLYLSENRLNSSLVFLESLPSLRYLQLRSNPLQSLRISDSRPSNLSFLGLSDTAIRTLDPELFQQWPNLTSLDLSNNNLNNALPSTLFDPLNKLVNLTLIKSNLTILPASLFSNLVSLKRLGLQMNPLTVPLSESLFRSLTQLTDLNLSYCNLTDLPENLFQNLKSLRVLNLERNKLEFLPANLLSDTVNLRELRLGNNRLSQLPEILLTNCMQLESLYLNHNQLEVLDIDFSSQTSLETIRLQHNKLHTIEKNSFERLQNLVEADMSFNNLTLEPAPNEMLDPFEQQSIFAYSIRLRSVNLSHNKIAQFYAEWINLVELQFLNFSHNKVEELHYNADLTMFPDGVQLDLRHNPIKRILFDRIMPPEGTLKGKTLYLGNNSLTCDCNTLEFAKYVRKGMGSAIQYDWNVITDSSFTCDKPENLRYQKPGSVDLQDLKCTVPTGKGCPDRCTCQYRSVDRAILADCSSANFTDFREKIDYVPQNRIELNLSHNHLTSLDWLSDPKHSNTIWVSLDSNQLTSNGTNWTGLRLPQNLQYLSLVGNRLETWNTDGLTWLNDTLANQTKLRIELRDNPWTCECSWYRFFTETPIGNQIDQGDIACYLNRHNSQLVELKRLTVAQVCTTHISVAAIVAMVVAFLAVLAALLTVLSYRYRRSLLIWLFAKGWCLSCITEPEVDDDKLYDAFVSYSHKDEDFVLDELVPRLEGSAKTQPSIQDPEQVPQYRLCLHYRDWLAGEWIPDQIARSVAQSRRTIVILSEHFVESVWGRLEFRTAYTQALEDKHNRLIIIVRGELPSVDIMDQELVNYLKLNTYLRWDDPWFWQRLRYALPHKKSKISAKTQLLTQSHAPTLDLSSGGCKGLPPLPLRRDDKVQLVGVNIELTPTTTPSPTCQDVRPPDFDVQKNISGTGL